MTPSQSKDELKRRLGQPLKRLPVRDGLAAMCAFYAEQRAEDVVPEEDGDMLLYQWGTYDFKRPESFQLNITRQFLVPDEDEPYQLSLTFHFQPTGTLRRLKGGTRWCRSPGGLAEFKEFVESSAAFKAVADGKPLRAEMGFYQC